MAIPTYPTRFIPEPFAADGQYTVIPETKPIAGRASYANGFPVETQRPIAEGGIAPNRLDFNGMFHILSALFHWQQSGGQWNWSAALNYQVPNIVYHNNVLWWCVQANGADTIVVQPGTNENYWLELLTALAGMGGSGGFVPVGTVITYYGATSPGGFLACNGAAFSATTYPQLYALLGRANTPDLRGYFVRGYDTRTTVDPDGGTRGIGSVQDNAMMPVEGYFSTSEETPGRGGLSGSFVADWSVRGDWMSDITVTNAPVVRLDLSQSMPVSTEIRPKNVNLLYCIKHD